MTNSIQATFASIVGELREPVFLADVDASGSRLTLHVRAGCDVDGLKDHAEYAMKQAGTATPVTVRAHGMRSLAFPKSIERWLAQFQLGTVVYDPTGIVTRARALLLAAKACRDADGGVVGVYFDPARYELFVLGRNHSVMGPAAVARVRDVIDRAWSAGGTARSPIAVRPIERLPARDLVPVDSAAASFTRRIVGAVGRWLAPGAIAMAFASMAMPASAKVDAARHLPSASTAPVSAEFGVLAGLSVFVDGGVRNGLDTFATTGLKRYFGTTDGAGYVQVAQISGSIRGVVVGDSPSSGAAAGGY
ncbi:MAG: hypothetical protein IPK81_03130 [Rhodospirillales bacterium]|nr:MAG: hypothetical protein IPK81_03130 [Rhodospirillales bacterium]